MSYSAKHNLIFIHIPKNAGTSIINSLEMYPHGHYQTYTNFYTMKRKHPTAKTFVIVRNPWDRMVSVYNYLKMKKSYWHSNDNTTAHGLTKDHVLVQHDCTNFKDFIYFLKTKKVTGPHIEPQVNWIPKQNGTFNIDHILFFENDLEQQLQTKLGVFVKIKEDNQSIKQYNTTYREYYDEETKNIVTEIFKDDITHFNYTF